MEGYFVVKCSSDGLTFEGPLSEATLKKRLNDREWGEIGSFADRVPKTDGFCLLLGEDQLLIIKGKLVQPTPEKVVETYNIP